MSSEDITTPCVSVITCVYNNREIAEPCIRAAIDTLGSTQIDWELVLVDNHSPDVHTRDLLHSDVSTDERVQVVDPGKNIGCHNGWNYGYEHRHRTDNAYAVKLDDDTEMLTKDWAPRLATALECVPGLAFVAGEIDCAGHAETEKRTYVHDVTLRVPKMFHPQATISFSCVMFRSAWLREVGPMCGLGLYGWEEAYYCWDAMQRGETIGVLPAVQAHHHGNDQRDPAYVLWKYVYGILQWTTLDAPAWEAAEMAGHCKRMRQLETEQKIPECVQPFFDLAKTL